MPLDTTTTERPEFSVPSYGIDRGTLWTTFSGKGVRYGGEVRKALDEFFKPDTEPSPMHFGERVLRGTTPEEHELHTPTYEEFFWRAWRSKEQPDAVVTALSFAIYLADRIEHGPTIGRFDALIAKRPAGGTATFLVTCDEEWGHVSLIMRAIGNQYPLRPRTRVLFA